MQAAVANGVDPETDEQEEVEPSHDSKIEVGFARVRHEADGEPRQGIGQHACDCEQHEAFVVVDTVALQDRDGDEGCEKRHLKQIESCDDNLIIGECRVVSYLTYSGVDCGDGTKANDQPSPNRAEYAELPMPLNSPGSDEASLCNEQHDPPGHYRTVDI